MKALYMEPYEAAEIIEIDDIRVLEIRDVTVCFHIRYI